MFPVIFRLPNGFELRSYGVLLVTAVLVAVWMGRLRAPRWGIAPEKVWDCAPWLVLPGVLAARLAYIVQHWDFYSTNPQQLWSLRFEGLTSFGGLIGGILGFSLWRRIAKVGFWEFMDVIAVPVLVAQAIGRIGCLLNGCCYGRPSDLWCAVPVGAGTERHLPAQLVDTALLLIGAWILARREKAAPPFGASFGAMLAVFGASRFLYEFLRAGSEEEFRAGIVSSAVSYLGLTNAQWLSLAMVILGAGIAWARRPRPKASEISV
ncbi:MAG: prolipoprotein diacylglyceryl transferase [Fimbriimonadaceae bacterium]|nr:prolipoprotein diacylglyceryl transferase [Fimbriimonadaceae bacterium]